nr:MAG TPA: hypothetical protein [Caudoviricetes sp.]
MSILVCVCCSVRDSCVATHCRSLGYVRRVTFCIGK